MGSPVPIGTPGRVVRDGRLVEVIMKHTVGETMACKRDVALGDVKDGDMIAKVIARKALELVIREELERSRLYWA